MDIGSLILLGVILPFEITILLLVYRIRRFILHLSPNLLEIITGLFFDKSSEPDPEDPKKEISRLKPKSATLAMFQAVGPALVEGMARSIKLKLPPNLPVGPGGAMDFGAILGLLPKKYQGFAALAMPLIQKYLGGGGGERTSSSNPFLKDLTP